MKRITLLTLIVLSNFFAHQAFSQLVITKTFGTNCTGTTAVYQLGGYGCSYYSWSISGGTNGTHFSYSYSSAQAFQVNWLVAGNYTLNCNYNCSSGGGSSSFNVTVGATPNYYSVSASGTAPYCASGAAFSINLSGSQSVVSYTLFPGSITKSGTGGPLQWTGLTAAGTYQITATNSTSGCTNNMGSVVVNQSPTSAVLSGATSICLGQSTNLSVVINGGTGPYSVVINGHGTVSNYTSGSAIAVSPSSTTNYTLGTITSANGCTLAGSGTATVTVGSPITSATLSGTASICSGQSTNLSVSIAGGVSPYTVNIAGYGTVTNYVSGTPIPVSPTATTNYTLGSITTATSCTYAGTGTATVTVNSGAVTAVLTGGASICVGQSSNLIVTITGGTGPYSFTLNGYGAVTNYTSGTPIPVTPSATTSYSLGTVTPTTGCSSAGSGTAVVTVSTPPSAITGVSGLRTNFLNEPTLQIVNGSLDATSFTWNFVRPDASGSSVPGQKVWMSVPTIDANTITVTPYKLGCAGAPFTYTFTGISSAFANTSLVTLPHAQIAPLHAVYFNLPKHNPFYQGCIEQFGELTINVALDMGDNYNLGANSFTTSLTAAITAYSDVPGVEQTWNVAFNLNPNTPEQIFSKKLTVDTKLLRFVKVQIITYSNAAVAAQNAIRFRAWTEEKNLVNVNNVVVTKNPFTPDNLKWEQTFSWTPSCADVTNYVFQLLRIYDSEQPDWKNALTIETESSNTSITISMAEGSGNYLWRVIPIGNKPDGIANPLNWPSNLELQPIDLTSFPYTHPEDSKNWIYSRTFTEGNKLSEQVTYGNGLQQVAQQQTRIQGINQVVASQTLQDFAGRNALISVPIPTGLQQLGYVGNLLKRSDNAVYRVTDFDDDSNIRTPALASDLNGYYSGTDQVVGSGVFNAGVASAQGYPYSRTFFGPDGEVREQAGVGLAHSVVGGKTVMTEYSDPSEAELVRLFGADAPSITSVQKITTYDANGIASISYKTKDGKVIATALELGSSSGALIPISSASVSLYEEIKGYEKIDDNTIVSKKTLFFAKPTSATLDYQITPTLLKELCNSSSTENLVGYYPFDGNANDQSSRLNHATIVGTSVTPTADAFGVANSAYNIVAGTSYIQIPDGSDNDFGTDDFTVSFWVKKNAASTASANNTGICKWNGTAGTNEWAVQIGKGTSGNIPQLLIESGTTTYSVSATTNMSLGVWYNITAMRSGNQLLIYVNGDLQGTATLPSTVTINNRPGLNVLLGRFLTAGNNYSNAAFDDVQIYRRALTASEVSTIQSRGTICKTCDYKIDLLLFKAGDAAATTLASQTIQAGNCVDQVSLKWDPAAQNISFDALKKYRIEKRITLLNADVTGKTYLASHLQAVEDKYRTQIAATPTIQAITGINGYLSTNDMQGLKTYLQPYYNSANNNYVIPVGTTGSCKDFIYIPNFDVCPTGTALYNETDCKRYIGSSGKTFSEYFKDYYQGNSNVNLLDATDRNSDGQLNDQTFLYFNNLYQTPAQKIYFGPGGTNLGDFDQMVINMKTDNQLTCEQVWKVWELEVAGFEANSKINVSGNTAGMGSDAANYSQDLLTFSNVASKTYSLYESFMRAMDNKLQAAMSTTDICANRASTTLPYFILNTQLYGFFRTTSGASPTVVAPDLTHAYRLVYFNETFDQHIKSLKFYRGIYSNAQIEDGAIIPSLEDFTALSNCDKHSMAVSSQYGSATIPESEIQKNITAVRNKCSQACQQRSGEFRAKVIQSLMLQNSATLIEHYNTYIDPYLDADIATAGVQTYWVGVKDASRNTTGFTISECELDLMVDALVRNCSNYCNTPLTPQDLDNPSKPGTKVRVYGTDQERLKLEQAFKYDFDVQVNASTVTSCSAGYDYISSQTISESSQRQNLNIDITAGWTYGAVLGAPSNPANFDYVFTVTNTSDYGTGSVGSLRWAINQANLITDTSKTKLINFNIPGSGKQTIIVPYYGYTITAQNVTIDGTTQPGFVASNGPSIALQACSTCSSVTLGFVSGTGGNGNNGLIKGLEFRKFRVSASGDTNTTGPQNTKVIGNIFIPEGMNSAVVHIIGDGSIVKGNFVDVNAASYDFYIDGKSNVVGGPTKNDGNVIVGLDSRNYWSAIGLLNSNAQFPSYIQNNMIVNLTNSYDNNVNTNYFSAIFLATWGPSQYVIAQGNLVTLASLNYYQGMSIIRDGPEPQNPSNRPVISSVQVDPLLSPTKWDVTGNIGSGTAGMVELFLTDRQHIYQNKTYPGNILKSYGIVVTDANGNWQFQDIDLPSGYFLVALNSEVNKQTSYASAPFAIPINCSITHSLCFKFTTPKNYVVTVPADMVPYTYNPVEIPCATLSSSFISNIIQTQTEQIIRSRVNSFQSNYFQQCGDPSLIQDKLTLSYASGLYQFTLYYYDRAGNLLRTVPPEGVLPLDVSTGTAINTAKITTPQHLMVTEYQYNSLAQLVREHSPDGTPKPNNLIERPLGTLTEPQLDDDTYYSSFIYSSKSLLRFSRNAKQKLDPQLPFSYTKYDLLGRAIEGGEAIGYDYATLVANRDQIGASSYPQTGTRQVTTTVYTDPFTGTLPSGYTQRNLNNRVSYTLLDEDPSPTSPGNEVYTVYSYDPHGNVEWLAQIIPGMDNPRVIEYEFDLISNKMNQVKYNPGKPDQFFHKYEYDASSRLKTVLTSNDGYMWNRDARYEYYLHGPLKRTIIGEDEVQGIDYTYTIHGWLKAINHAYLDKTTDPGQDAVGTSQTGRDAFGMALGYYTGDYLHTNSTLDASHASTFTPAAGKDLYNGNIASWTTNIGSWKSGTSIYYHYLTGQRFAYDVLNRLRTVNMFTNTAYTASNDYAATYTYSGNGNIVTSTATTYPNVTLDNLAYTYPTYSSRPLNNRLQRVTDAAAASSFPDDVEAGQSATNYQYDAIGNLIRDEQQKTKISWTPYGKVKKVEKTDIAGTLTGDRTEFMYDAAGNRVAKKIINTSGLAKSQYYVRDASGNIMAVYEKIEQPGNTPELTVAEIPIYGSSRIGRYMGYINLSGNVTPLNEDEVRISTNTTRSSYEGVDYLLNNGTELTLSPGFSFTANTNTGATFTVRAAQASGTPAVADLYGRILKNRQYELTDHLGNTRAVVSDQKQSTLAGNLPGTYEPELLNINHYYAFGMDQPGRTWSAAGKYRYGFNGKEKDTDGEWGNTSYDYGFRIYNPAIAKFLSVDPLTKNYPWYTPYQFAGNKPIAAIDLDGAEELSSKELNGEGVYELGAIIAQNDAEYQFQGNGRWVRVYSGETRDGIQYSTKNLWAGVPEGLSGYHGYTYDLEDLEMRHYIMNSGSRVLKQAVKDFEDAGYAEPMTRSNYWDTYGEYLGKLMLMESYMNNGLSMAENAQGGNDLPTPKKMNSVNITRSTTKLLHIESDDYSVYALFKYENGHKTEMFGDEKAFGDRLEITDIAFYPKGVKGNKLKNEFGDQNMRETLAHLQDYALKKGYSELRVQYERSPNSSSKKPGHKFDHTFKLKKKK